MKSTTRRIGGGLVAVIAAAALLTGCTTPPGSTGEGSTTLTLASIVQPASFDPADVQEGNYVQYAQPVYDSLTLRNPDGSVSPWLATGWTWSEDKLVLTMNLRDDVDFTDGEHFDAEAAKANLIHFRDSTGPHADLLSEVTDVTVTGDYTIEIHNSRPNPSLEIYLGNMAGMMAAPDKLDDGSLKTTPVGSGPYTLDTANTVSGDSYSFVRNPDYWNPDALPFDTIIVKYIADNTARFNALVSGQIDGGIGSGVDDQATAAGMNIVRSVGNWGGLSLFDRAGEVNPALADVRVRQALNYAIDKDTSLNLVKAYGSATTTASIFDPAGPAYVKEAEKAYPYDPEKAKSLLAAAGYPDGFELVMNTNAPGQSEEINSFIKDQLGKVGITVTWVPTEATQVFPDILAKKYAAAFTFFNTPDPWQAINQWLTPSASWNPFNSSDPKLEELVRKAQYAGGDAQIAVYQEINKYIVDQAWFAPWLDLEGAYYTSAGVTTEMQAGQVVPSIYNYKPAE